MKSSSDKGSPLDTPKTKSRMFTKRDRDKSDKTDKVEETMVNYLIRRVASVIPVLLAITVLVFLIMHAVPGDPVLMMLQEADVTPEIVEQVRETLGFNDPIPVQYGKWISGVLRGNLGYSFIRRQPVTTMVMRVLPSTLELTMWGLMLAVVVGVIFGTLAAINVNSWMDTFFMLIAILGVSMPSFWFGLMMIFVFSLRLGWLPATGTGGVERLIMPVLTLAYISAAVIARMVRASVLDVMGLDYVRTARAKGLSQKVVVMRHVVRNALIPTVTIVGLRFGQLLAGTVIIETVFSRPGIGRMMINGILDLDYQVVQAGVLISATLYMTVNILVDILYATLDPRITYS